jgi:hypothetical protein
MYIKEERTSACALQDAAYNAGRSRSHVLLFLRVELGASNGDGRQLVDRKYAATETLVQYHQEMNTLCLLQWS